VTITGTDLNGASAVKFGNVPAASFTVESETKITAVAPPSKVVAPVDVTATTLAGTSPIVNADRFYYEGCTVPKLRGKTVKTARRSLGRAGCKLGKVTRRTKQGKKGRILSQQTKPGKVLALHAKVSVTVGK
jgi:hypothetical protein